MRRSGWMVLSFVVVIRSLQLAAQTTFPTVYVSSGAGQQILAINGSSGAITGVCNATFTPQDVVVGPDGLVYVADTAGNRILRLTPPLPAPPASAPAANCVLETIYDKSTASCTGTCPAGPEGPSFLRINTLDLYFNTHGTSSGVWKIPNIAAPASCTPACPAPVKVINPFNSSASGTGVDFDIFGNLLAVDQANKKVLRAIAPSFSSVTQFIPSGLTAPVGVALNTCGDVLVASGTSVKRYNSTTGASLDSRSFGNKNNAQYLEVDSANRLYVVTAQDATGKGGTVWRLDPPTASPLTPCALGSFTQGFALALKSNLVAGLSSGNAIGLGISATSFQIGAQSFTSAHPTNIYDFGAQHTLSITCNGVSSPFSLAVTARRSQPTDAVGPEVTFSPATNWPSTTSTQCPAQIAAPQCLHYGSQHGFCTQYIEQAFDGTTALTDDQLATHCSNFTFKIGFFSAEFVAEPGMAHVSTDGLTPPQAATAQYTDCQSHDYYPAAEPGVDGGIGGRGSNSKHTVFNSGLAQDNGTINLTSPVSSCGLTVTCNPQFNVGQNIAVKFRLTKSDGSPITNATEQLSILRIQHTPPGGPTVSGEIVPQTVRSTNNSNFDNFFDPNGSGQYSYGADSSAFDPLPAGTTAVYQLTIWGNGAPPFSVNISGQF